MSARRSSTVVRRKLTGSTLSFAPVPTPRTPPPAPLDPEAVAAALAPFGSSRMLPGAAYTDPAVLAWEIEHLFEGSWVCVGRVGDLDRPGAQRATWVGRTGVLVVRDDDGGLHAYANICRHRGHELLPCGSTATRPFIVCPYHSWSYALDGSLRAAARFGELDPDEFGLVRLASHQWGGWLFVNVSGTAAPFATHAGDLVDVLAAWPIERLVPVVTHRYELAANWKLVQENYQECYHCPSIHPELCRVSVHSSGDNLHGVEGAWVGGTMELEAGAVTMSVDGRSGGVVIDTLSERQRRTVTYVGLFPNLLVAAHPDYVMTHRVEPIDAERSRIECSWLFPPEAVARDGFDPAYAVDFWDVVNRQDWAAVESVQRALGSPAYVPGVLAPHEDAVYELVTMVARAYTGLPFASTTDAPCHP